MNWDDDPEVQRALRERSARVSILRSAILWMPLFLVMFGALVYFFIDVVTGGEQGTVFLLVVLSVLSLLFGFQALQAVLDLAGKPHRETQLVTRRWSRNDSFVMRTHYIRLESGQILRGDKAMLNEIDAGHRVEGAVLPAFGGAHRRGAAEGAEGADAGGFVSGAGAAVAGR